MCLLCCRYQELNNPVQHDTVHEKSSELETVKVSAEVIITYHNFIAVCGARAQILKVRLVKIFIIIIYQLQNHLHIVRVVILERLKVNNS